MDVSGGEGVVSEGVLKILVLEIVMCFIDIRVETICIVILDIAKAVVVFV